MIPPEAALIAWIFVSIAMFAVVTPLRAFLLTYVVGYLILPVEIGGGIWFTGSIYITQSIHIDKITACNIGALVGTIVFASHLFRRYRFHWVDGAYGMVLAGVMCTSLANGDGPKEGLSHVIENLRFYFPLILLSRLYLTTAEDFYQALRAVVGAAFVYAFVCIAECRLSPWMHRSVYGYFPHSFDQFMRYGLFRPIGFLRHAIEVSFFMGVGAALSGWLWYRRLLTPLWGVVPGWVVVGTILVGLAATLTFSGFSAFLLTAGVFAMLAVSHRRWLLAALPILAVMWMVGRYTNVIDASLMLKAAGTLDPSRAESLAYRLDAERINLVQTQGHLLFGRGPFTGMARTEEGYFRVAVDAWWLITLVFYGVVGIAGWGLLYGAGIVDAFRRWRWLTPDLQALAGGAAVILSVQYIDFLFNAFPSPLLLIVNMGLVGTLQAYRPAAEPYLIPIEWAGVEGVEDNLEPLPEGAVGP